MSNVASTFDKEFNNLSNGADMFRNCEWVSNASNSTQDAVSSCCTASSQLSENYTNSCCSVRSNVASVKEVEEVQKNINVMSF